MKNIVGQIASKENFYHRNDEVKRIIRSLDANANIQLTAPRRVGKTSLLYYLKDNPPPGYKCLYVEVEDARSKNDFYRKIFKEIVKSQVIGTSKKLEEQLKAKTGFLARLNGIKIAGLGIDLNRVEGTNYEDELINLLSGIDLGQDKLILMIDEFPEVILNIIEDHGGQISAAKKFLQSNRALRSQPEFQGKIQFIYSGSNSLNITVANLETPALINDLNSIPVYPLKTTEAEDLIRQVLATYNYKITPLETDYAISKIEWNIPFYIQLLIQEMINQIDPEEKITHEVIDRSFERIMEQRNDHHFEHYVKRLTRVFTKDQLQFVQLFLNMLAKCESLPKAAVQDTANGIISESEIRNVINTLKYDGYIISTGQGAFKFNSPILKQWWFNHEC